MTTSDLINVDQSWFETEPGQHLGGRNATRKIKNSIGEEAFFKTPPLHVQANEVLAYVFAEKLGLPCAITKFATLFEGTGNPQKGIISLLVKGIEPIDWPLVPDEIRNNPKKYLMNMPDLGKITVFDIWTHNVDRNPGNLIMSKKSEWKKFLVYMIDNEECFYGFPDVFNRHDADPGWSEITKFVQLPELKNSLKYSEIDESINEIESIDDDTINTLVGLIPIEYYNPIQAKNVCELLQKRRTILREVIKIWCQTNNQL